jgi:hypothetical protein
MKLDASEDCDIASAASAASYHSNAAWGQTGNGLVKTRNRCAFSSAAPFVILCPAMGEPLEADLGTTPLPPGRGDPTAGPWQRLRDYAAGLSPLPPKGAALERLLYGLSQPLLGLRVILVDRRLLNESLTPALLLGGFCALLALLGADSLSAVPRKFYRTFVVLAPVPSILFANHYARLAASAHRGLQLGACEARRTTIGRAFLHAVMQTVVVAVALAPLFALLFRLPLLGKLLAAGASALWVLHWIVVEAFDSARVIHLSKAPFAIAPPEVWFVRATQRLGQRIPYIGFLFRAFAHTCRFLSRPWREEIVMTERHKALVFGFALMTAALLAIPILNLLFRPIIIVASVHLLARLREAGESVEDRAII